MSETESLNYAIKVHTRHLFEEVLENRTTGPLRIPLKVMEDLLRQVAMRASELHDDKLDALMMRLALYTMSDPDSSDYDPERVEAYLRRYQ